MTKKKLQYFSKFYREWADVLDTDNLSELKKYGYRIRTKPENSILTKLSKILKITR